MCVYVCIDIYIFLCKYLLTYDTLYIDIDNNLFFTFVFVNNIHQQQLWGEYIHFPPIKIKFSYF